MSDWAGGTSEGGREANSGRAGRGRAVLDCGDDRARDLCPVFQEGWRRDKSVRFAAGLRGGDLPSRAAGSPRGRGEVLLEDGAVSTIMGTRGATPSCL